MANKYKITNYGNTRTVYVKGQSWEVSKNASMTIDDRKVPEAKEVADAFEILPFVDVKVMKQIMVKVRKKKKKKKKVAAKIRKKTKRRKVKRRKK